MVKDLDSALERLAATPVDRDLRHVEPEVWARVERGRSASVTAAAADLVRVASVTLALVIGVASGTAMAAAGRPDEMAVFSLNAHLSPSNLLGARR